MLTEMTTESIPDWMLISYLQVKLQILHVSFRNCSESHIWKLNYNPFNGYTNLRLSLKVNDNRNDNSKHTWTDVYFVSTSQASDLASDWKSHSGCGAGLHVDLHIMQQLFVVKSQLLSHIHLNDKHKKSWPNFHFASSRLSSDFASYWESRSGCSAGLHIDLHIMQRLWFEETLLLSHFHRNGEHMKIWTNHHFASSSLSSDFASYWEYRSGCSAGLRIDLHIMQWLWFVETLLLSHFLRNIEHLKTWHNYFFAFSSLSSDFASYWESRSGWCSSGLHIDLHIMQPLWFEETLLLSHFHRNNEHKKTWPNAYFASSSLSLAFAYYWEIHSGCGAGLHIDLHITQQLWVVETLLLSHFHRNDKHNKTWSNAYLASSSLSSDFASYWESCCGCGARLDIDLHIMQRLWFVEFLLLSHFHRNGEHKKTWPNYYFASSSLSSAFASYWESSCSGYGAGLRIEFHNCQCLWCNG